MLTGKPKGKRPLGRPRRRWEGNIRGDLNEISINMKNLVDSAQDKDCCECGIKPPSFLGHGVVRIFVTLKCQAKITLVEIVQDRDSKLYW